jgi:hypothetical protein
MRAQPKTFTTEGAEETEEEEPKSGKKFFSALSLLRDANLPDRLFFAFAWDDSVCVL